MVDGQRGSEQFDAGDEEEETPLERYVLQAWPAAPTPPRTVVATSPWSQYWAFGSQAERLVASLAHGPDPERLTAVIDGALAAHPGVQDRISAGDARYQGGIVRYVQEQVRVTYGQGVYDDLQQDHEAVARLITERAAA